MRPRKPLVIDTSALDRARKGTASHLTANPPIRYQRTEDPRAEFFRLMKDPDPASMEIAEDLVRQHGLKLDDLSEEMALGEGYTITRRGPEYFSRRGSVYSRVTTGAFIQSLDEEPIYVFWYVVAGPAAGSRTRVFIDKHKSDADASISYRVRIGGYGHDSDWIGGAWPEARAIREATLIAWEIAKWLKRRPSGDAKAISADLDRIVKSKAMPLVRGTGISMRQDLVNPAGLTGVKAGYQASPRHALSGGGLSTSTKITRNGDLTNEQAEARFLELLRDPDPVSIDVAQDLALEYHLHIDEIGERAAQSTHTPDRGPSGGFVGPNTIRFGLFLLDDTANRETAVTWYVNRVSTSGWRSKAGEYTVEMDTVFNGHRSWDIVGARLMQEQANVLALRYAWHIVRLLRTSLAANAARPNGPQITIQQISYGILQGFEDDPTARDLVSIKAGTFPDFGDD